MQPMPRASSRPASLALQCLIAVLVVALARPPVAQASPRELLTSVCLGASGPRIAVVVISQDLRASQQQGALEDAAEAALERAARFSVVTVHDAFNPTAAKKQDVRLEESRELMKSGRQALDDLDNVKATEAFTQAVEALKETDLSRNFPALLDAWTMKAAGHATGGENGPAKKDIEAVVALAPKAEFTPTFFAPDLIKFAEAQRKFAANAKGELLVRTEPPGARVWVDGTYRGVSPVTVAGLTGAKHFIAASEGGYALAQSQSGPGEEVLPLASAEIGPGWKKATSEIKKDPEGSTRDSAAQALGKAAQLDQVLLVLSKKSLAGEQLDLIGVRLEVKDGHNASFLQATVNPGDPEKLAAFFDALTGKDAKRDGRDAVHHFKGGGSSPLLTALGFSALGLGAVSLINGTVFGILANIRHNAYLTTPQTKSFDSASLKRDGQTFAVVADISFFVIPVLAVAGGVVLLYLGKFIEKIFGKGADSPSSGSEAKAGPDDLKRRELDRRAAEDRRAADERAKEDERRRDDERKREEDRKKEGSSKASDDKRRADEEEARKKEEEEAKRKEEEEASTKKLSRKEQAALDKKKKEEEKKARQEEERQAAEERKRLDDEKKGSPRLTKKQQKEEDERRKEEEEKKAADEARLKTDAEAKKKKDDEDRKKKEDADKKKKTEDHDDLRNY